MNATVGAGVRVFINDPNYDFHNLTIGGRVEAVGQVALTGSATVGNMSGTGLDILAGAVISSTSLGVTATGSVSSSTTATNIVAASIAGTITETGGMMSHTAIVCREYGLPAVTGVARATVHLRTGQCVRLDATAGTVTVLG